MADDLDVEALLEAPFKKESGEGQPDSGKNSPPDDKEKERHKRKDRSSRSRSKSPQHKRRSRSKDRSRNRSRSHSHDHRGRSRSRGGRRGSGRRDQRPRDVRRSRSPERLRSKSSERSRKNRSRSPAFRRPVPRANTDQPRQNKRPDAETLDQGDRPSRRHNPQAPEAEMESSPRKPQPTSPVPTRTPRVPSPDPEPPSEDRDHRTVMCMQLSARVTSKELENFFGKIGQVREVKMIADKNSRKSKGIAYVEFFDEKSIPGALQMNGQKLFGIPMIVQPTMAEKNKLAAQAQNLKKAEGPRKLYVGSLHYNINEEMLRAVFEPFGQIDKIIVQRDEAGISRGYGFVEFKDSESAEKAMSNLNGFELAGRAIKVNHVTERDMAVADSLDADDADMGIGMTPQSRASLMAKLAEGHNAGLTVPQMPVLVAPVSSNCFVLSNMFDPMRETEPNWDADIRDDVYEECGKFGGVIHIYVDKLSQGNVYVKCANAQVATNASNALNGRFFAGKKIVAQFIPEGTYNLKFPAAVTNAFLRS